jgi:large subunit ribosomal protein L4
MTQVPVKNVRGEVVGSVELDDQVFGIEPNRAVLHQAVVTQLANQRRGTHDTKTRGEVAGGTHKVYRQKGTGRARQGDRRAPHWTGGGVVFGPHPRSYHRHMPRKMRRLAMRSALSARVAEEALTVVDELRVPSPKTKEMTSILRALGLERGALIVVPERDDDVYRAASNLERVRTVTPGGLNLLDVLNYRHVVLTRSAAEMLTQLVLKASGPRARRQASANGSTDESNATEGPDVVAPKRASRAAGTASRTSAAAGGVTTADASGSESGAVETGRVPDETTAQIEADHVAMDDAALASPVAADVALADAAADVAAPDSAPAKPGGRRAASRAGDSEAPEGAGEAGAVQRPDVVDEGPEGNGPKGSTA